MRKTFILPLLVACLAPSSIQAAAPAFASLQYSNRLEMLVEGRPVATYVFGDPKILRPYFAHLRAPGDLQVTRTHPPVAGVDATDHDTMHPGLWLAFGDINGQDFWRNKGRIEHVRFIEPPHAEKGQLSFAAENRLQSTTGQTIGTQISRITLDAVPQGFLLSWQADLLPVAEELVFGDQEEMGLGVRVATEITEKNGGVIVASSGAKTAKATWGKSFAWCDYSGGLGDHRVGVTLMPDPANFRPSWFHNRDYGLMVANPFGRKAMNQGVTSRIVVNKGDRLSVRFGIYLHAAASATETDIPSVYRQFLAGTAPGSASDALADEKALFSVARRLPGSPIIRPAMLPGTDGANINGPSLIRAPAWVPNRLGVYYLYFAHHSGKYIRLAYADRLEGPWKVYEPGTLQLKEAPGCTGHIASPDVQVDDARREIRMYFHGPAKAGGGQKSFVAVSKDGLRFKASEEVLGQFYFRVFPWQNAWFAMAKGGLLYRSDDGLTRFVQGTNPFPGGEARDENANTPGPRHVALHRVGPELRVYYSNIGDAPERILRRRLQLAGDWRTWTAAAPEEVLRPETEDEGVTLPLKKSVAGAMKGRENALRDPGIFVDTDGRVYLLYSVAGESGIGIAELLSPP